MKDKRFLKVFATTASSPLSLHDLLVLSFLIYQDRYHCWPSNKQIAQATGITRNTVAKSLLRLEFDRAIAENKILYDNITGWFRRCNDTDGEHFGQKMAGWIYYVASKDAHNPLTVASAAIYSYILGCANNGFRPPHGWSNNYLAKVLSISAQTVATSLTTLALYQLVEIRGRDYGVRVKLNETQLTYFADKNKAVGHAAGGNIFILGEDDDNVNNLPLRQKDENDIILTVEQTIAYLGAELSKEFERSQYDKYLKNIRKQNRSWRQSTLRVFFERIKKTLVERVAGSP